MKCFGQLKKPIEETIQFDKLTLQIISVAKKVVQHQWCNNVRIPKPQINHQLSDQAKRPQQFIFVQAYPAAHSAHCSFTKYPNISQKT